MGEILAGHAIAMVGVHAMSFTLGHAQAIDRRRPRALCSRSRFRMFEWLSGGTSSHYRLKTLDARLRGTAQHMRPRDEVIPGLPLATQRDARRPDLEKQSQ